MKSVEYAALIGLDWADQKHDVCLLVPGQAGPERLTLVNTPEALHDWLGTLRERFGGRPVALALEKTRSGLVHVLMQSDFIVLYPLNCKSGSKRVASGPPTHSTATTRSICVIWRSMDSTR